MSEFVAKQSILESLRCKPVVRWDFPVKRRRSADDKQEEYREEEGY